MVGGGEPNLLGVEVLDEKLVQSRVLLKLLGVHAVADHLLVTHVSRQVADPGRADVEHPASGRDLLAVQLGELPEERVVHVRAQARHRVEVSVVHRVELRSAGAVEHLASDGAARRGDGKRAPRGAGCLSARAQRRGERRRRRREHLEGRTQHAR